MADDDDGPVVADSPQTAETRREFESAVALASFYNPYNEYE